MMRKFVYSLAAIVVLSLVALAQGKSEERTGVVIDKACSARHLKAANPQESAASEGKDCALMANCEKSGYGIFTADGKFTKFDEKGNALAKAALEKSKKDKGPTFKVVGKKTGEVIAVESITPVE